MAWTSEYSRVMYNGDLMGQRAHPRHNDCDSCCSECAEMYSETFECKYCERRYCESCKSQHQCPPDNGAEDQ